MKRWLLTGAMLVGLMAPLAYAQTVVQDNLSGNETWNVGQGPGGPGGFITSSQVRMSFTKVLNAVTGTFGTGALAALRSGGLVLFTTQPLAATTLTLPPNPVPDGARAGFCNATNANFATTAIAMVTSTGQTLPNAISITTLTASSCVEVVFNRSTTTWYRIR